MNDFPELVPIIQMVTAIATLVGIVLNTRKLNRTAAQVEKIETNTNSLAERAEAAARTTGLAQGNLQGRVEQTAERKAENDQ